MTGDEAAGQASELTASGRMRPEIWGVLDQALVSGVNFLTLILVARSLVPTEFGYFVLAFTILQTAGTLQAALITRPHNVLAAVRHGREYVDYSTTAALEQVGFGAVLAVGALIAAALSAAAGSSHAVLILVLAPALLSWQLQEFGRRILYTERRLAAAFANDLLSYGGQALAIVVLWQLDLLTGARALLSLAVAFAVGAAVLAWQLRRDFSGRPDAASLRSSWRFGKWLGVAEVGQWFSTQFYVYLAAAVIGAAASAALKAGQTLLGPMSVFLTFVTSYLPIVLVRELEAMRGVRSKAGRSLGRVLVVVIPYCVLIAIFAKPVVELVYGAQYAQYTDVVRLFSLYYVLLAFSTVAVAALSAQGMTRDVFRGQAAGAVLSLAVGWLLLRAFGPAGGVMGMILSWALAMVLFARALRAAPGRGVPLVGAAPPATPGPGL